MGLLLPMTIVYLEFRSREELQLMPQTEEEHNLEMAQMEEVEEMGDKMVRHGLPRPLRDQYEVKNSL